MGIEPILDSGRDREKMEKGEPIAQALRRLNHLQGDQERDVSQYKPKNPLEKTRQKDPARKQ